MRPYSDTELSGRIMRTFRFDVESEEMQWHRDARDRCVTVVSGEGWLIQINDRLPAAMATGSTFSIPHDVWHRVHRGTTDLVILIDETD